MLYAILCIHDEQLVCSWTPEHDAEVMERLARVQQPLAERGKLGPVARLHGGGTARTLRKDREPFVVTDGPFTETKEQILGFFVIDCESDAEAMEIAQALGDANPGGAYEVRPISFFAPGTLPVVAPEQAPLTA